MQTNKTLLIVLDGFGLKRSLKGNAIKLADTDYFDKLKKQSLYLPLLASGNEVGLPEGFMGNSEVGHFTIGAGRTIYQSLENINQTIKKNKFNNLKDLQTLKRHLQKTKGNLHLIGMISDKGVHSHMEHLFALLKFAQKEKIKNVYIHAITDGRDAPERSAIKYINQINKKIKEYNLGSIVSIIGRFFAMDRDQNWKRTQKAYDLIINAKGEKSQTAKEAINHAYENGIKTDYYIPAYNINNQNPGVKSEDAMIFFNFRTDRAAQLTEAITKKNHPNTKQTLKKKPLFICFGPYTKTNPILFPAPTVKNNLGSILAENKIKQLRISETEKFAHVSFFFNSQNKKKYLKETRIIIPSKKVKSFDLKPQMSANELTEELIKQIQSNKYPVIISNYANCDLVGHSGNLKATIKAVECIAKNLENVVIEAKKYNYHLIITADHGNAENMLTKSGGQDPSHTTNPVPCYIITPQNNKFQINDKIKTPSLKNIASTLLKILNIKAPKEYGKSLIK